MTLKDEQLMCQCSLGFLAERVRYMLSSRDVIGLAGCLLFR